RREEYIELNDYLHPGMYNPYTWEGCVVKMSDKIAYLARDIEDALRLNILDEKQIDELKDDINIISNGQFHAINNGSIVNYFIADVCQNSTVEKGICLSDEAFEVMKKIMSFNYQHIYLIDRVKIHSNYVHLILNSIFDFLYKYNKQAKDHHRNVIEELSQDQKIYPKTISGYIHWLEKYSHMERFQRDERYQNHLIYDFENDDKAMAKSIIDYLSGMSDVYILKIFNELISFA
ncbi:MAG: metal-dependent phosphohydrolase, partial [Faecalibacillus sp.]